jgi:hypothetical protein
MPFGLRSSCRPLWGTPHDGEVHARLWPAVLRCLELPGGAGRSDAMLHASSHGTKSCLNVVSADGVRLCTSPCLGAVHPKLGGSAHTNRRSRRCGNGLEHVSFHRPLSGENRGERIWASLHVSAMCGPSASRWSPYRLLACGAKVLWRGPEAARGDRHHDRGPVLSRII